MVSLNLPITLTDDARQKTGKVGRESCQYVVKSDDVAFCN
jgi:hypothetical protein